MIKGYSHFGMVAVERDGWVSFSSASQNWNSITRLHYAAIKRIVNLGNTVQKKKRKKERKKEKS